MGKQPTFVPIIEDNVYGFLEDDPPLAALAPADRRVASDTSIGALMSRHRALSSTRDFLDPKRR
jgi:DNA-binding transcriptional MocR family regulator